MSKALDPRLVSTFTHDVFDEPDDQVVKAPNVAVEFEPGDIDVVLHLIENFDSFGSAGSVSEEIAKRIQLLHETMTEALTFVNENPL